MTCGFCACVCLESVWLRELCPVFWLSRSLCESWVNADCRKSEACLPATAEPPEVRESHEIGVGSAPGKVESVGDKGTLVILTPKRLTPSNPEHIAFVSRVQMYWRLEGLLKLAVEPRS